MQKLGLLPAFFGLFIQVFGQDATEVSTAPYTAEYSGTLSRLKQSFEAPWTPVAVVMPDTSNQWQYWNTVDNFAFGKNRGSLPMIADLDALHPYFRDKIVALIQICRDKGIELAIVETYRTRAKQNEYRAMGRIYTRSTGGRSKHQYGLAVDVVPIVDSVAQWHNAALWRKVGLAGERLGMRWGGRWRHPYDPGHFEWSGGLSSVMLEHGAAPRIPQPVNYPCINEDLARLSRFWNAWEDEQSAVAHSPAAKTAMK